MQRDGHPLSDQELVQAALSGDQGCMSRLVERHGGIVHHMVRCHTTDPECVEDLVQDTWLRALSRLHTLRQPERFGCWLGSLARRVALTWVRQRRQEQRLRLRAVSRDRAWSGEGIERQESAERLLLAIDRLSPRQREAVALCGIEGQGRRQAALLLGVDESALKGRLARARRALRRELAGQVALEV